MKRPAIIIGIFSIAALLGACIFVALSSQYAYRLALLQMNSLRFSVLSAPLMQYGVVQSIDGSVFDIKYQNGQVLQVRVPDTTYIAREDLVSESGVYTGVTDPTPAAISDIQVGDKVATLLKRDDQGRLYPVIMLFGNPL